ncbi:MAG: alanine:cation symporter family protein [Ruminococcaceae bacterium]|nr:alanine:cation symporter family protein [Oscillospiraceae bacterium]
MQWLTDVNKNIYDFVWGYGVYLLLAVGLITTVMTGVFQITHIKHWFSQTLGQIFKKDVSGHVKGKSISQFQALCTALAATIGVGNIAGVAAAIVTGGPGAVFWMWIAAFLGMMTNYSENVLGIYFRRKNADGEWSGGAMYYLEDGLGKMKYGKFFGKPLAIIFCIFAILASFGIGAMGQINKIVVNMVKAFEIKPLTGVELYEGVTLYHLILGIVLVVIAALIILGGIKRIANFAEKIVPFMVILFVGGSIAIIAINHAEVGAAFSAIFKYAFTVPAALGGVAGSLIKTVITTGCKRGVYSNEAGLGSSVMVHSNSNVIEPVRQGLWGIFEVFADTMIVCTMTALVVLISIDINVFGVEGGTAGIDDATLVATAFGNHFGPIGEGFVAIAILLFAFTTVLGWDHYGSKAWEYLFGVKSIKVYKVIHLITIMLGALLTSSLAWDISDTFNGLMMVPNLIGVVACAGIVIKITKNYKERKFKKKDVEPMISFFPDVQAEQAKALGENTEK